MAITTTNTYNFNPGLGEFVINAFARCGVRRTEITAQHMEDARFEANLLMSDWTADGVNLWQVENTSIALSEGQSTWQPQSNIVFLLDVYITVNNTDRLIMPISRSDYAAIANKFTLGYPTSYWFDRVADPIVYLWPVPDQDNTYTLTYWFMRQAQDSNLAGGALIDVPWYYFDAFAWGLASRLAYIYAPEKVQVIQPRADKAWLRALQVGSENVPMKISPQLRSYFR